jgi:hypothetical protein
VLVRDAKIEFPQLPVSAHRHLAERVRGIDFGILAEANWAAPHNRVSNRSGDEDLITKCHPDTSNPLAGPRDEFFNLLHIQSAAFSETAQSTFLKIDNLLE